MLLSIKNIGRIRDASIKFDGITVIAGDNNTGKSTIGKVLYCLFNGFYDIDNRVITSRANAIVKEATNNSLRPQTRNLIGNVANELSKMKTENKGQDDILQKIKEIILPYYRNNLYNENITTELEQSISRALALSDDDAKHSILQRTFAAEMGGDICHVNYPDSEAVVKLKIKNEEFVLNFKDDKICSIVQPFDLFSRAILIDTPFIMDDLAMPRYNNRTYHHRDALLRMLYEEDSSIIDDGSENAVAKALSEKKFQSVFEKISGITKGDFVKSSFDVIKYKEEGLREALSISALSTGIKSFLIIKKLIDNSQLKDKGVLIFDEPEIHLHPEWQLVFAEVIVLLQKEYNLSLVVTTHSAYFLFALEIFSAKHEIADKCNYYLAETNNNDKVSKFTDVTNNLEPLYKKHANTFQALENMRWNNA